MDGNSKRETGYQVIWRKAGAWYCLSVYMDESNVNESGRSKKYSMQMNLMNPIVNKWLNKWKEQ